MQHALRLTNRMYVRRMSLVSKRRRIAHVRMRVTRASHRRRYPRPKYERENRDDTKNGGKVQPPCALRTTSYLDRSKARRKLSGNVSFNEICYLRGRLFCRRS